MTNNFKRYFLLLVIFSSLTSTKVFTQTNKHSERLQLSYHNSGSDNARMRFLVKAISDSLNDGRLHFVYDLASEGLMLAKKNSIDTMQGIFYFDIGKAYAYHYIKPDSAIFYFKKVLPYFHNK